MSRRRTVQDRLDEVEDEGGDEGGEGPQQGGQDQAEHEGGQLQTGVEPLPDLAGPVHHLGHQLVRHHPVEEGEAPQPDQRGLVPGRELRRLQVGVGPGGQCSPLSLVEVQRGSPLIGRKLQSDTVGFHRRPCAIRNQRGASNIHSFGYSSWFFMT